jgi:hypothetical protein
MSLVGRWRKMSDDDCADRYPDEIEFGETRFLARKGPEQGFIIWDVGGYRLLGENEVLLQIATDEQVSYALKLDDSTVTFIDDEGCRFAYRRVD